MAASSSMPTSFSRRSLLGALGAGAIALPGASLLSGCGGGAGGGGGNEINFLYMGDASGQKQWNALFEEFRKTNPDITLKAQGLATNSNWADFFNQVTSRMAGGQVPDMIQIATEGMRLFASKGLLEPLDSYIEKDKALIDEYYADCDPKLVEWNAKYGSPDGKTYYLPGEFNTMCMWAHKELYQKAGVELPADGADWTWDDFLAGAKLIKEKTGAYAYNAAPEYFVGVMPWLLTNGASTFDADWAQPTVNTPEAIEAATYCRQLVADGLSPQPGGTFDEATAFAQGKLATLGRGRWGIVDLQGVDAVDKAVIVKWPTKSTEGTPVGWNGYPIMKQSKNKDAAWTFAKFLISKEGSSFFAKQGGTIVPARKSVADSDSFLDGAPEGTPLMYEALSYATPIPSPDRGAEIQKEIEGTWEQIMAGNAEPEAGLNALQDKLAGLV